MLKQELLQVECVNDFEEENVNGASSLSEYACCESYFLMLAIARTADVLTGRECDLVYVLRTLNSVID